MVLSEANWQNFLIKGFRECNAVVFNVCPNRYTTKGMPDLYVCHSYWRGWLEIKGEKTKVERHQVYTMQELRKRKDNAFILRYPGKIISPDRTFLDNFLDTDIPTLLHKLARFSSDA